MFAPAPSPKIPEKLFLQKQDGAGHELEWSLPQPSDRSNPMFQI
jgi:hypothetical protein